MSASGDLFDLISSMTKQEKRYFKLYATFYTSEKTNAYTKLFDAYDKLKTHDEERLQQAVRSEPFAKRLANVRHQLTALTLNSLAAFNAGKSVNADMREMLANIEVLYNKGLYAQCRKAIARAKTKAQRSEKHLQFVEILYWERRLLFRDVSDALEDELDAHYAERSAAIESISCTERYLEALDRFQTTAKRYKRLRNADDLAALRHIRDKTLLAPDQNALTYTARIARSNALAIFCWLNGEYAEALERYRATIELCEQNPTYLQENADQYKGHITSYLSCCLALKYFDDFEETLRKLKDAPAGDPAAEISVFENIAYLELTYYLNYGQLEEGLRLASAIEQDIERHYDKIRPNRLITLYHNCSILYFLAGKHLKALDHINNILSIAQAELKQDIQEFTRIFRLVNHLELGDTYALEYMFRSTYRYLSKRHALNDFEKVVLRAIKKLFDAPDGSVRQTVYRSLRTELLATLYAPGDKEPVGLMELLFWVESKVRREPIADIFTAKMREGRNMDKKALFPPE